ncbi:MAG TPA: FAD-dependent oxidoreductase [Aestuariivirga sp.]|nr:FAD-dependent oxidoreductase [Aestuariivirga sp.]
MKQLARRKKLRSGETLWTAHTPGGIAATARLGHQFYDLVILGGGVSGALAAERLSRRGDRKILLIDRRLPASGSTSASTALIQWEIDEPLTVLSRKVGARVARQCYQASYAAVASLMRLVRSQQIECDMVKRSSLLIAGNALSGAALRREAAARRRAGLPCQMLATEELQAIYDFDRDGGILCSGNCELDPRRLTLSLLKLVKQRGVEMRWQEEALVLEPAQAGVFITMSDGSVLAARRVIAATGYEALPQLPKSSYDLISTWALATKPVPPDCLWKNRLLVWEASDPYLYFRTTPDNRIIVGGEDEDFYDPRRRDAKTAQKTRRILAKLRKLLPGVDLEVDYQWAGTFAASPTGLPVIGEVAELPNVFSILGAGGNGITFSVIAADMAEAWLADKSHPLTPVLAPGAANKKKKGKKS